MSLIRNEPAAMMRPDPREPEASSYENIWAEERRPPSIAILVVGRPAREHHAVHPSDVIAKM
jgi:hypothetical protein